jgi:hypothetical protein
MPRAPARIRKRFVEGETEMLDPETEETLVWGFVRVLDHFCTMRSIDEWQASWSRWRDTVLPKALEYRPGSRPIAMYVLGEIPVREWRINLPENAAWKHIDVRGRDGKLTRHWLDAPATFLDPEVKHLQRLGLVDADELRRHREWVRRGDDPYPLEISLRD